MKTYYLSIGQHIFGTVKADSKASAKAYFEEEFVSEILNGRAKGQSWTVTSYKPIPEPTMAQMRMGITKTL